MLGFLGDVPPSPTGLDPSENTAFGIALLVVTALAVVAVAAVLFNRRRR